MFSTTGDPPQHEVAAWLDFESETTGWLSKLHKATFWHAEVRSTYLSGASNLDSLMAAYYESADKLLKACETVDPGFRKSTKTTAVTLRIRMLALATCFRDLATAELASQKLYDDIGCGDFHIVAAQLDTGVYEAAGESDPEEMDTS